MELQYILPIAALTLLLAITLYGIWNSIRKIEALEEGLDAQVAYIQKISDIIKDSRKNLDKLDEKGAFKSDDEVGRFFESMKEIQTILDTFTVPEEYGKKKT